MMDTTSPFYTPTRQDSSQQGGAQQTTPQQQQQPQPQQQQSSQWLAPLQTTSPYASPTATSPSLDPSYANIFGGGGSNSTENGRAGGGLTRSGSSLSLNMSSLSVASPSLSPGGVGVQGLSSPVTPLTPAQQQQQQQQQSGLFRYTAPDQQGQQPVNDNSLYPTRPPGSSRSSTSSNNPPLTLTTTTTSTTPLTSPSHANPRKRGPPSDPPPITIPTIYDPSPHSGHSHYEDNDMSYGLGPGGGMDMDDSPTSTGFPDLGGGPMSGGGAGGGGGQVGSGGVGVGAKGVGTNNFVSKLYQMISDPKSARFISWTEHGTSFVVQNVGEFSRTILGAHFKHNNFSSFVRQLNMYGFSKINRTPRAQRTSTNDQTWEFAHAKFLRGRPDLLEEIRRKALEPDPTIKQRVELPGELASQLNYIRDENRRVVRALEREQDRTRRLGEVVRGLWDVVGRGFPGELIPPFPADLLETSPLSAHPDERGEDGPPIYITSPVSNSPQHYGSTTLEPLYTHHTLHQMSPASSPTTGEFPQLPPNSAGGGGGPTRGLSLPHIVTTSQPSSSAGGHGGHQRLGSLGGMYEPPSSPSPISGPEDDSGTWGDISHQQRVKRQRTTPSPHPPHNTPLHQQHPHSHATLPMATTHLNANHHHGHRGRARSDSTPGTLTPNNNVWSGGGGGGGGLRPRSGSGLGLVGGVGPYNNNNGAGGTGGLMPLGLGLGGIPSPNNANREGDRGDGCP